MKTEREIKDLCRQVGEALETWKNPKEEYLSARQFLRGAFAAFAWVLGYETDAYLRWKILRFLAAKEEVVQGKVSTEIAEKLKEVTKKFPKRVQKEIAQLEMQSREFFNKDGEPIE